HAVLAGIRNGAARGECCDARTARGAQASVHAVAMQQSVAALEVQGRGRIEILAREIAIGPRAPEDVVERVLAPRFRHAARDHLLRQDVEWLAGLRRPVELA